jgi:8-oxo-dGTP pyrophosphatase MutT (NUDIX family)
LLRKFQELNNFIYNENYYKLIFGKTHIGYVHSKIAKHIILNVKDVYLLEKNIYLENTSEIKVKKIILKITETLSKKKNFFIPSSELFSCRNTIDGKEFFKLDRKLVEYLGIRGYGVHLIAYIKKKNSYKLWVPKRNKNKLASPSKFDNSVAGGVRAGEGIFSALEREAYEEAGLKKKQLNNVKLVGTLNYNWKNSPYTLRRDTLYLFDLEVDDKFKPQCLDGEVEKFELMEWKKVLKLMQNTDSIKNNCNLVFFNFMVRHSLINEKLEKNYEEILRV